MNQVLQILEEDALTSPEKIAERLGRSVEQVREQIQQLEDQKIVLGYTAIVDEEKAGRERVNAVIEVKISPEREGGFDRIAERIARHDEVKDCYLMSGGYDLLVVLEGENLRQLATFVSEKLATITGVLSTATHFRLKAYKERGTLFSQKTFDERLKVSP